jgi:hypothetical protein
VKTFAVGLGFTSALAALGMLAGLPAKGLGDPTGSGQPASLGKMTAFWWHRPVVDRWMKGRLGFQKIPDYLCDPSLSFPYRRKPQPEEVPFADHLTVVRVLGGWNSAWNTGEAAERPVKECDLAWRGPDGKINYRWELLGPRLDHYVRNGYELTLVLDKHPLVFSGNVFADRPAGPAGLNAGHAGLPIGKNTRRPRKPATARRRPRRITGSGRRSSGSCAGSLRPAMAARRLTASVFGWERRTRDGNGSPGLSPNSRHGSPTPTKRDLRRSRTLS